MSAQPQRQPGRYDTSEKLFSTAQHFIPGGVNSPVRAFNAVGGTPVFIAGAEGAIVQDMDGNQYVDFVGSWGPMILGHANGHVTEALKNVVEAGTSFGAPTDRETCLADFICERHEHVDMVRLVNSGTEATMSAIRLARGYTGKNRIIKCDGCYHGHGDSLLVAAGSGLATHGIPSSAGVPDALAELTTVVPFNNIDAAKEAFSKHDDISCIILEPIAGNMGCIPPEAGYLEGVRALCDQNDALLIIDEVMTGFRVHKGSAQTLYNIRPDIACFGKIIGGGLPLAAYGGRREIMEHLAPLGDVYQAGTLSGNPLAVTAGITTIEQLTGDVYAQLEKTSESFTQQLGELCNKYDITHSITRVGSMFSLFFCEKTPKNFTEVKESDVVFFNRFFHALLDQGIYWPPSAFEACFISTAHDDKLLAHTLSGIDKALATLKN